MEKVFYKAKELLEERDYNEEDEKRNLNWVHWDTTFDNNEKWQLRLMGDDMSSFVNFPDVVVVSKYKKDQLAFEV